MGEHGVWQFACDTSYRSNIQVKVYILFAESEKNVNPLKIGTYVEDADDSKTGLKTWLKFGYFVYSKCSYYCVVVFVSLCEITYSEQK